MGNNPWADLARSLYVGEWVEQALCREIGHELFFPEKGESAEPAKQVCAKCPVRRECLEDALATGARYGVLGGKSERERRAIVLQRKRDAA